MSHLQLNWKLGSNPGEKETMKKSSTKEKYKLREGSIKKRNEVEHRKKEPKKRGPKPRPKAQTMSKYRRKAANLRERERMGEINVAFEKLRGKIPSPVLPENARCEKLTKINILHVAINYIRALESIMETGDAGVHVYGTSIVQSPNLPLHPECEQPTAEKPPQTPPKITPNAIRKGNGSKKSKAVTKPPPQPMESSSTKSTPRTKNPSSSSSSEDSGINMDFEESESEADEYACPDWTELTSTLELFPVSNIVQNLMPQRGNLDTLLSSVSSQQQNQHIFNTIQQNKLTNILQPKDLNRSNSNVSCGASASYDLDLFGDLNSSFDSCLGDSPSAVASAVGATADSDGIIPFSEDPFELVF